MDTSSVGLAIDNYFQSFIKAIQNGGGNPDPALVMAAQNVRLSQAAHEEVENAVWTSLAAVIGWDFDYPTKFARAEGFVGNIREVEGVQSASGIVEACRIGLINSIKAGDPTKVEAPLREFWSRNPTYMPRHMGRCYPHGHPELTDMNQAVECQLTTLERVAQSLIDTAAAAAGEGK